MATPTQAERVAAVGYDYAGRAKEEFRNCNLCGHDAFALITDRDRYGFEARTHLCLKCGLGFMSPHLTPAEYRHFYAHYYRPLCSAMMGNGQSENMEALVDDQKVYARWLHENLLSRYITPQHATLLDIGGSTGVVASYVARHSAVTPIVLDPSRDELDTAERAGCETIHALWEDYEPDSSQQYDVVLLCRTIDHLLDVAGSLRKIRRIVRPGGLFYVDIVDFPSLAHTCNCISRATKIDHVYYLSHVPTVAYLQQAGFEPVAVDCSRNERIGYLCRPCEPRQVTFDPAYPLHLLESLQNLPRLPRRKPPTRNRSLVARGLDRLLGGAR